MRSFREYLIEELSDTLSSKNTVDYKITKETSSSLSAKFEVKGEPYLFKFDLLYDDEIKGVEMTVFDAAFLHKKKGYGITGTGNVKEVFSTTLQLLKYAVKKYNPDAIMFDAAEGRSREKLYDRFAKQAEKFLPGYDGSEQVFGSGSYSIIKKSKLKEYNEVNKS
jgi:hypothetical protein